MIFQILTHQLSPEFLLQIIQMIHYNECWGFFIKKIFWRFFLEETSSSRALPPRRFGAEIRLFIPGCQSRMYYVFCDEWFCSLLHTSACPLANFMSFARCHWQKSYYFGNGFLLIDWSTLNSNRYQKSVFDSWTRH